jgi:hypothetical protein
MKRTSRIIAAFAVFALCLLGQIGTGTITGRITDSTGAVVPNAPITVIATDTNFTFKTTTNDDGIYRVLSLNPGKYRVTIEAQGFKKLIQDVELRTGDTLAVDGALQVGSLSESIEVSSAATLLETETSATGSVVAGSVLYDMPLYQRYVNSTMNLVPGMTSGGYAYGGDLGSYHLAGQRSGAIGIFEDGVNGNDQQSGTGTVKPLQNSVAEVKVLTTVPPAEYGHSAGGVISVVKKSGTNEIHGMASMYGRTRSMQHRLFFDQLRTSQPTPGRPNGVPVFFMQPDANVGGPIVKNKTFFYFGYQRLHEKKVAQVSATAPTTAMLGGNFNFPGVTANPIYDPATTRRLADGTWARDLFPGNVVPLNRFDPVARTVIGIDPWVRPNREGRYLNTGPDGNLLADEFAKVFFDDFNLRLDHQFNPNFKIYGSYTENRQNGLGRPINIKETMGEFDASQGRNAPFYGRNISAGKTWIVRPHIINDARVGYYRRWNITEIPRYGENWSQLLGIPNSSLNLVPGFGGSSTDRYSAETIYGIYGNQPSQLINETLSFRNDLSIIKGTHAFKTGYEVLRFRLNNAVPTYAALYSFNGSTAGVNPNGSLIANTGNTFAGFLTGYVSQAQFRADLTSWLPRSSIHSFYFQDDWKFSPTLTINWGLRYSNESPFNTKYGLMSNFDPNATDDVTGQKGAIVHPTSGLNKRDSNNFNPRLGLAWHPKERWVFRGGVGMYTVDVKFPSQKGQFDEYTALANVQANPGDPTPIYQISRAAAPPNFVVRSNGSAPYRGTNFGSRGVEWWDPNLRNPYTINWNGSVQYEFTRDYLVEFSYQGSAGNGLIERWQYNTFPIDFGAGNPTLQNAVFAAPQNYRPFAHLGDVFLRSNFGHSTFHSGTLKLEKRLSKGVFFNTFYTFSKCINSQDTDNAGSGVAPVQNRDLEKARCGYDRNHRFIGVVNYELPFGKGKRFANGGGWTNWIVGGLEVSWIQTIESGNPINFTFGNSPYNYYPTFAGSRRPDVVGEPDYDFGKWNNGGGDRFTPLNRPKVVDISAFAWPGGCGTSTTAVNPTGCNFRVGSAGRNILTGPRLLWSQISVQKNFRFGERYNAQIRWDFQNALKTYNFTGPANTVDFRNPASFGHLLDDPRTASLGGQPLMNLTIMFAF